MAIQFREDDPFAEYCPNCGQYSGGEGFCPNCGTEIYDEEGFEEFDEEGGENSEEH